MSGFLKQAIIKFFYDTFTYCTFENFSNKFKFFLLFFIYGVGKLMSFSIFKKNVFLKSEENKWMNFLFYFRFFFLFFLLIYISLGIYIVKPAEQAILTRFGKFNRMVTQGPHWYPLFIEEKIIVNTEKLNSSVHGAPMLTKDENIVVIEIEVQYRISDVVKKVFRFTQPERTLREAADSSMRQIVGRSALDFIVTIGKEQLAYEIKEQLQSILDTYDIGFFVAAVILKEAKVPSEVKNSFDDVIRAQEEKEQLKHQAEAFANRIVPEARGRAAQMIEEANAYKKEVVLLAKGETIRFELLLEQYEKAPDVTKERLYITSLETIFKKSNKVLLDIATNIPNSGSLIYLPIDRLLHKPV